MQRVLALGCVLALWVAFPASATILTFDDVGVADKAAIPDGYGGLNWDFMNVVDVNLRPPSGYANAAVSGDWVAFNAMGIPAAASGTLFDFNSVYLTAAWKDGLSVQVQGFLGAALLYDQTVVVDTSGPTLFNFDYLGIDRVLFTSFGGTPNPDFNFLEPGNQFAMDDFSFNAAPIPEPTASLLFGGGLLVVGRALRRRTA